MTRNLISSPLLAAWCHGFAIAQHKNTLTLVKCTKYNSIMNSTYFCIRRMRLSHYLAMWPKRRFIILYLVRLKLGGSAQKQPLTFLVCGDRIVRHRPPHLNGSENNPNRQGHSNMSSPRKDQPQTKGETGPSRVLLNASTAFGCR